MSGPSIAFDAGLGRYLLTAGHGDGGRLGVFEGPEPWGPWRTVGYEDNWLGMRGGDYLGVRFPTKWMADGDTTLWAVFSCYGKAGCGPYHDRYNLIRATLALSPAGAAATRRPLASPAAPARPAAAGSTVPPARRRPR